ncbi:MAG: acyl-CoA synthetase FdrA [Anaerolineae bacterium]|nr:acyl-CoA synthetase FdrA [Anaerolineae bacterium]
MATGFVIRRNQYYDSVFLMGVNKRLSDTAGVQQTAVLMGSEKNKELLDDIGIHDPLIGAAQPNDLIVAVVADSQQIVDEILGDLDQALQVIADSSPDSVWHTFEDGLAQKPDANLVVISIPGEYAAREAHKAIEAGLNVFIFSSNVTVAEELELKRAASQKGLLVMGPDCGTSLIGGVGVGFANAVRQGTIGVIGASGTGLQEFTTQVHNAGLGISHAIGTGTHDVSDEIGGITTFAALDALEADTKTEVIAFVSKPPGKHMLAKLLERLQKSQKPIVCCFLGADRLPTAGDRLHLATTIDEAVLQAIQAVGAETARLSPSLTPEELARCERERAGWSPEQKYMRGLFAGGTFCFQTQQILRDAGLEVYSNGPLDTKFLLAHPDQSKAHTLVDMGDEHYTLGRPHPMIDGSLRKMRIEREALDPEVAVIYLDFILGYSASLDPVGELLDGIIQARRIAGRRGAHLTVVASICGTDADPQDLNLQASMLREQGVIVFNSNARAALFCAQLLGTN